MMHRKNKSLNFNQIRPPVAKLIGFSIVRGGRGKAVSRMKAREAHKNFNGTIHGGILCDLADATMGAAFASLLEPFESGVTIEFKINFLRPVLSGDLICAFAKTIFSGRSLYHLECELKNTKGKLVAKASSICKKSYRG